MDPSYEGRDVIMAEKETLNFMSLPEGQKRVGTKWVFFPKYKADGSVERYNERLLVKGYTQTYGVDCRETFFPVAKLNTLRVVLSLIVNLD